MNTAEAMRAWIHGWTVSRGTAGPVPTPWGFTVDVGLPGHVVRHVLSAADGYRLDTWKRAGVARTLIRTADDAFAARGRAAVTGTAFVVDQVETDPARQRRGLGRLVMHTLADIAAGQGATAGVPVATPQGRALYETAGWHVLAPLTGAIRS